MIPYEATRTVTGKAQAAAIISRLLAELAYAGLLEGEPPLLANQTLARAWTWNPDLLEGTTGPRPHEVAIAAIALALAVRHQAQRQNEILQNVYFLALALLLGEIAAQADTYPFHPLDLRLLDAAAATLAADPSQLEHEPLLDWHGI
jgi:hypothetical protein